MSDGDIHVYPENDLRDHITDGSHPCWCNPMHQQEAAGCIIIHNSMDGREAFEEGLRKPS